MPTQITCILAGNDGAGGIVDFILAGIVAVGLLIYLIYAMFNPEKF
jgi:K+-transporting ATPase KdpF subunit